MRFKSLMLQLSLAVVLITTAVLTGFGFYRYQSNARQFDSALHEELELSAKRLTTNLSLTLFNYSDEGSINIIVAEMENTNIEGVILYESGESMPIFEFVRMEDGSVSSSRSFTPNDSSVSVRRKVLYKDEVLGEVLVFMTTKYMKQRLKSEFISDMIQIFTLNIVLIFLVIFMLKTRFIGPIMKLTRVTSEISRGMLEQPIEVKGNDEICILAQSFSRMRDSIKLQISDLNSEIMERKRAEEKLLHLRNYLKNIVDSMPSVLVGVDSEGNITQWNLKAEDSTGVSEEKAQGLVLQDVFPLMAQEMGKIRNAIQRKETIKDSKVASFMDGQKRFSDITIYPLIGNDSIGAVIRIDDVTDKVRMEEMMIQSEKMLSVGGLAAGMAHEINNPLAGIMQNIQVMQNRLREDLPKNRAVAQECGIGMEQITAYMKNRKIFSMIGAIMDSGQRASKIVDNMLSFSRKSKSMLTAHNLADLLDKAIELVESDYDMKKKYDFRQIEIVRKYDSSVPGVVCEGSKIQQVFLNILKNGAQAMAENRSEDKAPPCFTLHVMRDGECARIEIEDNGPGMEEAVLKRVFEPFFTTKDVGVGTGLGLSVSYFIVTENHKGEMFAESSPGMGAKFVIILPFK